jgi:endogenous inhibitor of DNA gyrase (YacG/DUF329 family)
MAPFDHSPPDPPDPPRERGARCPICSRAAVAAHRPFCSKRCADIDLNRWLSEVYRVPASDESGDKEEDEAKPES